MSQSSQEPLLQQLLELHAFDQQISALEREIGQSEEDLSAARQSLAALEAQLEQLNAELQRAQADARAGERAVDEKRDLLDRLRAKVNQVKTEKQYGAATLEFDLVRQEIRSLEDRVLEKLQTTEDLEGRREALQEELDAKRAEVEPMGHEVERRRAQLEEELAIKRDRRHNLAVRLDDRVLRLYDRVRRGRTEVALAPLTDESVCGNCMTAVTIQQELQIKGMSTIVCCEGCGVILYPGDMKRLP